MSTLQTYMGPYKLMASQGNVEPTTFPIGIPADSTDVKAVWGADKDAYANAISLIIYGTATADQTATVVLWGAKDNGPPERIASLSVVFGTGVKSTGVLWADAITPTSYHVSAGVEADTADNHVAQYAVDLAGYRYLNAYVTAKTATSVNVMIAPW